MNHHYAAPENGTYEDETLAVGDDGMALADYRAISWTWQTGLDDAFVVVPAHLAALHRLLCTHALTISHVRHCLHVLHPHAALVESTYRLGGYAALERVLDILYETKAL